MSSQDSNEKSQTPAVALVCVGLVAVTAIVFGQTVGHDFLNYDDNDYVYQNAVVMGGLTWRGIAWAFTHFHSSNWHPLTWISHMLDCEIFGSRPWGHHLTNVILHAAVAVSLFLVLWRYTSALSRSAVVAFLFAVHPLRVESVAWVAERKDLLSALFFVLTLGAYARYVARAFTLTRYVIVLIPLALGLMCKPMLVTAPLVLLALDVWPLQRIGTDSKRALLEKIPMLALSAASCAVTWMAQRTAMAPLEIISPEVRMSNAAVSCAVYLRQLLYPVGLALFYPLRESGPSGASIVISVVVLVAITTLAWRARARHPYVTMGWCWYLVMLVPVIGLVQVGSQAHADRYTYLPQIGLLIAIVWWAADRAALWDHGRRIVGSAATVVIGALILCSWTQTRHWRTRESIWVHTLACTADNAVAFNNLGSVLCDRGDVEGAAKCFDEAIRIQPRYAEAQGNWGVALHRMGRFEEARLRHEIALRFEPRSGKAHGDLALSLKELGDFAGAAREYRSALELAPESVEITNNAAWFLATCAVDAWRDGRRARELAESAAKASRYENPLVLDTLSAACAELGDFEDAMKWQELALAMASESETAMLDAHLQSFKRGEPLRNRVAGSAR